MSLVSTSRAFSLLPAIMFAMAGPTAAEVADDDFDGFVVSSLMESWTPSGSDYAASSDGVTLAATMEFGCEDGGATSAGTLQCSGSAYLDVVLAGVAACGSLNFTVHEMYCIMTPDGEHWMARIEC